MSDRSRLPQLSGATFITDGGMETTLIFDDGIDLPHFASFVLLDDASGADALRAYYKSYLEIAAQCGVGIEEGGDWRDRIRGLRANASEKSHAELDEAEELDPGDPQALARHYRELQARLPSLSVVGGCCGTSHRHVVEICAAVTG